MGFRARHCPACGLRFPVTDQSPLGESCPKCGAETAFVDPAWDTFAAARPSDPPGPPIRALLDNVRSLSNVGTVFRSADGVGAEHLYLAGFTPTPDHPKMSKTALGAQAHVPWSSHRDALDLASTLRERGLRLWALEGGSDSMSVFEAVGHAGGPDAPPIVLVCGHEVSGVDPRLQALCELSIEMPMSGVKGSLNVAVAFSIASYVLRHTLR